MTGYLMDGGWMMLPLLVCSITLVAVIIDRVPRGCEVRPREDAARGARGAGGERP